MVHEAMRRAGVAGSIVLLADDVPTEAIDALRALRALKPHVPPEMFVSAQPNAGWPERSGGLMRNT